MCLPPAEQYLMHANAKADQEPGKCRKINHFGLAGCAHPDFCDSLHDVLIILINYHLPRRILVHASSLYQT
jgi:hypothetical protein